MQCEAGRVDRAIGVIASVAKQSREETPSLDCFATLAMTIFSLFSSCKYGKNKMTQNHRELISLLFTLAIILMSAYITQEFFVPLTWAGIIAIATWPVYDRLQRRLGGRQLLAAFLLTLLFTLVIVIPIIWLSVILAKEIQFFSRYLMLAHAQGAPLPDWLSHLPWGSSYVQSFWAYVWENHTD